MEMLNIKIINKQFGKKALWPIEDVGKDYRYMSHNISFAHYISVIRLESEPDHFP